MTIHISLAYAIVEQVGGGVKLFRVRWVSSPGLDFACFNGESRCAQACNGAKRKVDGARLARPEYIEEGN